MTAISTDPLFLAATGMTAGFMFSRQVIALGDSYALPLRQVALSKRFQPLGTNRIQLEAP